MIQKIETWFTSILTSAFTAALTAAVKQAEYVNENKIRADTLREAAAEYRRLDVKKNKGQGHSWAAIKVEKFLEERAEKYDRAR